MELNTAAGYWEPHTSSVDFCESNYLHYNSIVEYHNTWSSIFGITAFGIIGILYNNPTKELRTIVAYGILALIGIGSAGLHGSLHWVYQSSDELPMIFLCNAVTFMIIEHDAPHGKPHQPRLPFYYGAMSLLQTVIYFQFQDYYLIFLLAFASGVFGLLYKLHFLIVERGHRRGLISKKLGWMAVSTFLGIGFPVWLMDMHFCHSYLGFVNDLPGMLRGMTPHVLWHFVAAYASYCSVACAVSCRLEELKIPFRLEYLFGCVPITTIGMKVKAESTQPFPSYQRK